MFFYFLFVVFLVALSCTMELISVFALKFMVSPCAGVDARSVFFRVNSLQTATKVVSGGRADFGRCEIGVSRIATGAIGERGQDLGNLI